MKIIKTTFNLTSDTFDSLASIAEKREATVSHTIRVAIANFLFLQGAIEEGGEILIKEKGDNIKRIAFR